MSEKVMTDKKDLLRFLPGGIIKLVLDDDLTLLYATGTFLHLIRSATLSLGREFPIAMKKIIYSADIIYVSQQLAMQKQRKDNMFILQFRILQPDGGFKWIMISGRRMEEEYINGSKAYPVYSCIAMDATSHMEKHNEIEQELKYQDIISGLSEDIFFVYEIANDTMIFKEVFREKFGKENVVKKFSSKLEKSKLIDPEERPQIIKIYQRIMNGKKQARFMMHLISKDGISTPYECYVSIIYDENKNPFRVIGKMTCNPLMKESDPALKAQALEDVKIKQPEFLDENVMMETLKTYPLDSLSAFLLLEVRNYKIVNALVETLNGEDILTTIEVILKERFRTLDMIGRLSANEFFVFMRDISEEKNATDKAELICNDVDGLYSFEHIKNGMTISIGVNFITESQENYQAMVEATREALKEAKKEKNSAYVISK